MASARAWAIGKPIVGTRATGRDRLLQQIWKEIIDYRASADYFKDLLNTAVETEVNPMQDFGFVDDPGRLLQLASVRKLTRGEVERLARGLAYEAVFDLLHLLDKKKLMNKKELQHLHDNLLTANPRGTS